MEAVGIEVGAALETKVTEDGAGLVLDEEASPTISVELVGLPFIVGVGVGPVELSIPNGVGESVTS